MSWSKNGFLNLSNCSDYSFSTFLAAALMKAASQGSWASYLEISISQSNFIIVEGQLNNARNPRQHQQQESLYSLKFKLYKLAYFHTNRPQMNKLELSEDSINPHSHSNNSQLPSTIQVNLKKSRQKQPTTSFLKENQSKHMNSIKPFISNVKERQRKISKRDSQKNLPIGIGMPNQNVSGLGGNCYESTSKNKSKKELSSKKVIEDSRNIGDLYSQLVTIKAQYKALKNSYTGLVRQKNQLTQRGQKQSANVLALKMELQRVRKQEQRWRNNVKFVEQQIERIKKQCVRVVEAEKFKNKKLQETLQQKQLMIAYLRSQLSVLNGETSTNNTGFFFQHTAPTFIKSTGILNQVQPLGQGHGQLGPNKIVSSVNKSIINNSAISSIQNNSDFMPLQLIDLPRQFNNRPRQISEDPSKNYIKSSDFKIEGNFYQQKPAKRQYIFSNEDDSLNFSYEKQMDKGNQFMSVQSSDPTVLTFTKKDVYILDEQQSQIFGGQNLEGKSEITQNPKQIDYKNKVLTSEKARKINKKEIKPVENKKKTKSIEDQSQKQHYNTQNSGEEQQNTHQERSNYTGEQEIMTFENRFAHQKNAHQQLMKIINPHLNQKKKSAKGSKDKDKDKEKGRGKQVSNNYQHDKKQISSKSKLQTKRVQPLEQETQIGQIKQSSAQTKKQCKKKISRKRKSQEGGGLARR